MLDIVRLTLRAAGRPVGHGGKGAPKIRLAYLSFRTILVVGFVIWAGGPENFVSMASSVGDSISKVIRAAEQTAPANPEQSSVETGATKHVENDGNNRP